MTTKISRTIAQGFAALALAGAGFSAQATGCTISHDGIPTGCNGNPPVTTTPGNSAADADAAAIAKQNAELTAKQQAELNAKQQAEQTAIQGQKTVVGNKGEVTGVNKSENALAAQTGDQKVNATTGKQETLTQVDASDRSTTTTKIDARSSAPVAVQATSSTFLAVPNGKGTCDIFEAKQSPKGGLGIQWDYNKSVGFTYDGGAVSSFKPDQQCLADMRLHEARMLRMKLEAEQNMQQAAVNAQRDAAVYSSGQAGQMVVIQRNYAAEAEAVTKEGSAVQKLFNLGAPKAPVVTAPAAAPAPVARKAAVKAAPVAAGSSLSIQARGAAADELAKKITCKTACPAPGAGK